MKSIFLSLFVFACISASAQQNDCPTWIGYTPDSIDVIKQNTEQMLQTKLKMSGNPDSKTIYEMKDDKDLSSLKIWMKGKKTIIGGDVTTAYNISSVRISGPADRIESLFAALKAKVTSCTTESANDLLVFGTNKIIVEKFGGDASKKNIPLSTLTLTSK